MTRPRAFWPCVIVSIVCFGLFAGIAMQVERENGLTQSDNRIAEDLRDHAGATPHLVTASKVLSFLGSWRTLVPIGLLVAGLLIRQRQYATSVVWVVALGLGALMNWLIKQGFQRPRPFASPDDDWSFPSGHSMNSFIYYGLLSYMLVLVIPRRWLKFAAATSLLGLVVLIGFSRMYLTRHYLSDVLGGFAFGAGWMAGWIAILETIRQRRPAPLQPKDELELVGADETMKTI